MEVLGGVIVGVVVWRSSSGSVVCFGVLIKGRLVIVGSVVLVVMVVVVMVAYAGSDSGMESRPFWSTVTVACTEPGGPEFESRTQLVVTDCELLRFEDCIFVPQSCKCYGNLSSKVE